MPLCFCSSALINNALEQRDLRPRIIRDKRPAIYYVGFLCPTQTGCLTPICERMTEEISAPVKRRKQAKVFSPEQARGELLAKLVKAGAKGAAHPISNRTAAAKRAVLEQVIAELEVEREIFIDRRKATAKLFLWSARPKIPTREGVATVLEEFAEREFPRLLSPADLKGVLGKDKETQALLFSAFELLASERRLLVLRYQDGKKKPKELYVHVDSLRRTLGEGQPQASSPAELINPDAPANASSAISAEGVHEAYRTIAQRTGFPAVPIATLQQESAVPMDALKQWIIEAYQSGRAILSFGDWSLADESKRAGSIELNGDRYLLVRLQE